MKTWDENVHCPDWQAKYNAELHFFCRAARPVQPVMKLLYFIYMFKHTLNKLKTFLLLNYTTLYFPMDEAVVSPLGFCSPYGQHSRATTVRPLPGLHKLAIVRKMSCEYYDNTTHVQECNACRYTRLLHVYS